MLALTPRIRIAACLAACLVALNCKRSEGPDDAEAAAPIPPEVAAYTSGTISRTSSVRVEFTEDVIPAEQIGQVVTEEGFEFEPAIPGAATWVSRRELEFKPKAPLPSGTSYKGECDLEDLGVGKEDLELSFTVMPQSFELSIGGLVAVGEDPAQQIFQGLILTGDSADAAQVEKMLKVSHGQRVLPATWVHAENDRRHAFTCNDVTRAEEDGELAIEVQGAPIGVERNVSEKVKVPGLNAFSVVAVRAVQQDAPHIEIRFSDPLARKQDLRGLVRVDGHPDLRTEIDGSVLRVYSGRVWSGEAAVVLDKSIINTRRKALGEIAPLQVSFEALLPKVRFATQGVILPTTQGLTLPIETANLRAVMVEATRVPFANLPQFLQVNGLGGDNEMRRVGRVAWRDVVPLPGSGQNFRWVRHGLDLTPLLKNHPHGLYRIKLTFAPQHIEYPCSEALPSGDLVWPEDQAAPSEDDSGEEESSSWDTYGEGGEGLSYYQLYENRKNPCHPGYYRAHTDHNITVTRNVLVSDLGLIAKRGADDSLLVAVTDLRTAQPLSGVKVRALDFQQQELATGDTGGDGLVRLTPNHRAYFIIAESNDQLGAVRLEDGAALAIGHFDVGGTQTKGGLKGFFYGERGVWRPGDDVYLTFILHDEAQRLPENHPVDFELRDARGALVDKAVRRGGVGGFYAFKTKTPPDAPTGLYVASAQVGGATFTHSVPIETVVPNRLKIDFDFGTERVTFDKPELDATLKAAWLHGAVAKDLSVKINATLTPKRTTFPKFEEYLFDDPTRRYTPVTQELFTGTLDEEGQVAVQAALPAGGDAPGLLLATLATYVYEPSGAFSVDRHSIEYATYPRYVGVRTPPGDKARGMLLTDQKHPIRVVALDGTGKPVNTKVEVALHKITWRWWWEKGEDESLADYAGSSMREPLQKGVIDLKNGEGTWEMEVKYPDWGRYLVTVRDLDGGHRSGKVVYIDWPGWAGRQQKDQPGGATVLSFTTDKAKYQVGEKVTITIPTALQGRALLSLESGTKVLQASWIEPQGETTTHTFTATADMAPNAYAHVTFLQPHLQAKNDLPIRLYGVAPLAVFDPKTKLEPVIQAPEVFEPESTGSLKITEKSGRAMTYTVAVVDEGLLGLTRFQTPEPWDHFYAREALGVRSWDLYDDVAGAFAGQLENLLAIGGGDEEEAAEDDTAHKSNRFEPMVRFMGPFQLAAGATASHAVPIPRYVGAVRVMVVAGTRDGAFGEAGKSVFVRRPLMLLGTLPRVLGPGEQAALPVAVFALDEKVKDVTVTAEVNGLLKLSGKREQKLTFKRPGDQFVSFPLQVGDKAGLGKVTLKAKGGAVSAEQVIEIDIRHPNRRVTDVLARTLEAGKSWDEDVKLVGMAGSNTVALELSRVPPLDLGHRLEELVRYPHGCIEQTTSSAFPQVYLSTLLELPPDRKAQVDTHVKAAIDKLRSFQLASGAFAYWPGSGEASEWGTVYAGHFLLEAQKAGYLVPAEMLPQWRENAAATARAWKAEEPRDDLEQAYRLYTLALSGASDVAAMNRLRAGTLSSPARWRLAAAYQMSGQPEVAKALLKDASAEVKEYRELSNTFGSTLRDQAMILEAAVLIKDERFADELAKALSEALTQEQWLSTQETAFALVAMARFVKAHPPAGEASYTASWNDQTTTASSKQAMLSLPWKVGEAVGGKLKVQNKGQGTLFARLVMSGVPAVGEEVAAENGLAVSVRYEEGGSSVEPTQVAQGKDLVARVTVRHVGAQGPYKELALSHLLPSGWEIYNQRLDSGGRTEADYRDIRDDRVYTYFDLKPGESKTFDVSVNAAYRGRFYLPPVSVEAMYNAKINGRTPGQWIEVIPAGGTG